MTLATKVQSAVDKAFAKVDSLLKDVIFANKSVQEFDFGSDAVVSIDSTFTTRGYIEQKTRKVDGVPVTVLSLMVKTAGIVFSGYTQVTVAGVVYKCNVTKSDDFVTMLELVKV
jgi:hypothetical protein